nr:CD3324 family protein [uncultured Anaerosporobacter sp.]
MRYINGQDLIPRELLDLLQDYVQGAYIYIPKREDAKRHWGEQTDYIMELKHRNKLIYQKYLEGVSTSNLISIFHLSSSSIRRIILQERRTCDFMNNQIPQLLTNWNISGEISQIYSTAWDISNQYVLKIYEDLGLLKRNITMLHALHDSGIPVARIIPLYDGRDYLEYHESYCILMDKLPGMNLVNISQKPAELSYQMGTVLGRLHLGFQRCEGRITF